MPQAFVDQQQFCSKGQCELNGRGFTGIETHVGHSKFGVDNPNPVRTRQDVDPRRGPTPVNDLGPDRTWHHDLAEEHGQHIQYANWGKIDER